MSSFGQDRSIRSHIARLLVTQALDAVWTAQPIPPVPVPVFSAPDDGHISYQVSAPVVKPEPVIALPLLSEGDRICIVGAGATGLYAAMMLKDLKIPFTILEANPTRVGGRIYTHRFTKDAKHRPKSDPLRYDYIDMGAMRFPKSDAHYPFFNLCDTVGLSDDLIEYHLVNNNTIVSYNGYKTNAGVVNAASDTFKVSDSLGGFVPDEFMQMYNTQAGMEYPNDGAFWVNRVFSPFISAFSTASAASAWAKLSQFDALSTRSFLGSPNPNPPPYLDPAPVDGPEDLNADVIFPNYPVAVIEWLEMVSTATGLYNNSFVESVIDASEFGAVAAATQAGKTTQSGDHEELDWFCLDGGSDMLIDAMLRYLGFLDANGNLLQRNGQGDELLMGHTVVGLDLEKGVGMSVRVKGATEPTKFAQVICTAPLSTLSSVDMATCDLTFTQKTAIRSLHYDASTKVALKWEKRWWEDSEIMKGKNIRGGVTATDKPVRMVVYPSYGAADQKNLPGVIIGSYSWSQDAQRLGALATSEDSKQELINIVLKDIYELHDVTEQQTGPLLDCAVQAWYNDPYARGAFALFGPGQFGSADARGNIQGFSMFASLKAPAAGGRLHFAGEATSIHHAWVVGALNSAWRAVANMLVGRPDLLERLVSGDLSQRYPTPAEESINEDDRRRLVAYGALGRI